VAEILELPSKSVVPLHAVKEIVSKAVDNYQEAGKTLGIVDRSADDESLHEGPVVDSAQIEMTERRRETMAVVVSLAKVLDRPLEGCQI
jgi:hypothetical protein